MPTSRLLARLTFALAAASATSISIAACGDDADGAKTTCLGAVPAPTSAGEQPACHGDSECPTGQFLSACYPPGQSACSGIAGDLIPRCSADSECGGQPSSPRLCQATNAAAKYCAAPCTSDASCESSLACDLATGRCEPRSCAVEACPADTFCTSAKVCAYQTCNAQRPCGEGSSCTATFICEPTPCTGATSGECPSTFACDADAKVCKRKTCACDGECGAGGFCVEGSCYATLGRCQGACAAGRPLRDEAGAFVLAPLVRTMGWTAS